MTSIRILAAAILASSGLILSTPALAAPKAGAAVASSGNLTVLVNQRQRDRNWSAKEDGKQWRRRDARRDANRRGDRVRRDDRQRTRDGDRTRRSDRNWRRDGDRDHARRSDRRVRRDGDRDHARRSDRRLRRDRDRDHARRADRGWRRDVYRDRARHHGNRYGRYKGKKPKHWRARYHPRQAYWIGRRLPWTRYVIINDYDDYYLPPPRRGSYYARVDNDVYLVAEATKLIIDAFVLLDATGR